MKQNVIATVVAALLFVTDTPLASTFYVATDGDDANPGSLEKPFATIIRSKAEVRQLITAGLQEDVQVFLRSGTYQLAQPLTFETQDSGTTQHSITYTAYPNERVVISGGRRITGWKRQDNHLWSVSISEVAVGQWYFRELYVNKKRAKRARTPNSGYYQVQEGKLSDDFLSWELKLQKEKLVNWKNLNDVEIIVLRTFETTRKKITQVDQATQRVLLKPPHVSIAKSDAEYTYPMARKSYYLENALEFMDEPEEWYLDRSSGVLNYWPSDNQDLSTAEVVAPVLSHLIVIKGQVDKPIRNLHFKGLTFSHATWELPEFGYLGNQAALYHVPDPNGKPSFKNQHGRMDAVISFEYAESCSLEESEVSHAGGYGVEMRRGCVNNLSQGNHIYDIGANGIMIGEALDSTDRANLVVGNRVLNNLIHNCGVTYFGAVGIWVGITAQTLIAHNLVYDLKYTGISIGWRWDKTPTNCKGNLVEYNHVHHVMNMLSDGGAIYTLGLQPGTIIRGNVIHDVGTGENSMVRGLYLDQGSSSLLIETNMIYRVAGNPVFDVWSEVLTDADIWRGNTFTRTDPLVAGIVGYGALFENNSYFDMPNNPTLDPAALTVEAWVKFLGFPTGKDPCVSIINKNFNELVNGNYALVVSHNNVGAYLNIGGGRDNCFAAWSNGNPISSNGWNHLAMTYDGRDLKVYCNGTLAGLSTVNRQRSTGTGDLRIGKGADNWSRAFHGIMDEIRIYNRALSAEEIAAQYAHPSALGSQPSTTPSQLTADFRPLNSSSSFSSNLQSPISNLPPDLVAYWSFDDMQDKMWRTLEQAGPQEPYRSRFAVDLESEEKGRELSDRSREREKKKTQNR